MKNYCFERYEGDQNPTWLSLIDHPDLINYILLDSDAATIQLAWGQTMEFPLTPHNEEELGPLYATWYEQWRATGEKDYVDPL